jgi:curved DNA-binding protein CbpA
MMKDFYYILGVDTGSTLDEIKEAYRKLSKKLHPDLNQGDKYFESRFRDIKEAFETLRDPQSRAKYDRDLSKNKPAGDAEENAKNKYYASPAADSKAYSSKFNKPIRRGPGIGMTITLIIIALVIGDYAIQSFSNSKLVKTAVVSSRAVGVVSHRVFKKHKKKHGLRSNTAPAIFNSRPNIASIHLVKKLFLKPTLTQSTPVKTVLIKPGQAKPSPVKPVQVQITADSDINQHKKDFLYATYVLPNVTGVINLRAYNQYNSNIIETIPAKSKVLVLEKGDVYYRVFYNNTIGYVPKWALEMK